MITDKVLRNFFVKNSLRQFFIRLTLTPLGIQKFQIDNSMIIFWPYLANIENIRFQLF